ncbi:hypothetical protein DM01DRAFT_1332363 [Hesseltinella vesiculosa]|uniref:Uncharacterized protein n=1 Tax=Hesseltinella vesiculosa TaxID=101127 RepID=A0A1X2GUT8_9FUNG|nr:hypothetical protein DM01DRAFT_1332363 [Hesseltinella vesiculosa]
MTSLAKKALVFYNPTPPVDYVPHLDTLIKNGSSGSIYIECTTENDDLSDVQQLFNLAPLNAQDAQAKSRFEGVRFGLVSRNETLLLLGSKAGYNTVPLPPGKLSLEEVSDLLVRGFTPVDVLIVDMSGGVGDSFFGWLQADVLIQPYLSSSLVCVITCSHELAAPAPEQQPVQSYEQKDGQRVQVHQDRRFVAGYWHPTTTRRDTVATFDTRQMQDLGAQRGILTWHFLPEICHMLGLLPKYGA